MAYLAKYSSLEHFLLFQWYQTSCFRLEVGVDARNLYIDNSYNMVCLLTLSSLKYSLHKYFCLKEDMKRSCFV